MKKIAAALALLLGLSGLASAQTVVRSSDDSGRVRFKSDGGRWAFIRGNGAPSGTTFGSENVPEDTLYIDEDTGTVYYFSAGVWTAGSASGLTPGTTTVGTSTDCFGFADAASLFQCDNTLAKLDNSGAGNGAFVVRKTPSGGSILSNFRSVIGTMPTTLTATFIGDLNYITGAGTSNELVVSRASYMVAGYTGAGKTYAQYNQNTSAGTNTGWLNLGSGNMGTYNESVATTTGATIGTYGYGGGGDLAVGVGGVAPVTKVSGVNIGVSGLAFNPSGTVIGGFFGFRATTPTFVSSGIYVDNAGISAPVAVFVDNSAVLPTTGPTATWQIMDGAWTQAGNGVLTSATMTAETQARQSGGLIHSYTWTNAQVVALGANLTGDITVATLPAKTQVSNAYVVITGQAAGPATVTVSCGDAIGGTPFINYVVPSDAKAAANTVYGDAVGERGTSIDVEFYNLPSYTATTLVTCHFISTGSNLDQVTGSTGRVILETATLP